MNAAAHTAGFRLILAVAACWAPAVCVLASGVVEEPEGYRMSEYRTPVPATLRGATVVDAEQLHALIEREPDTVPIDVLPAMRKPPDFPPGRLWRPPPRHNLPGTVWLPNVGDGDVSPVFKEYFIENLDRLTEKNKNRPLVFYCLMDCWMSWNSAKRALELGYRNVYWFPGGTDEWEALGYPLEHGKPVKMPDFREVEQ